MSLTITDLPTSWYDGEKYRPRLACGDASAWFVLDEAFLPVTRVPTSAPNEPEAGRTALRSAFEATYRDWDVPMDAAATESIAELATPGTAVITTGQQPGFLGGPLYTMLKAVTTVAAARAYRRETGRACVPVFWVAGDDHDLDEVRTTFLPGASVPSESPAADDTAFTFPGSPDRRPISSYSVDASARPVLDAARDHVRDRRFGTDVGELVSLYEGRGLAAGFAALLTKLLGGTGLLVIDPVRLRPLAAPLFERAITQRESLTRAIHRGRDDVRTKGLKPVVGERFPLFLMSSGKRHHLTPSAQGMRAEGGDLEDISEAKLLEMLAVDPTVFSTGALLRPFLQQYTLPSVLSIGGAAEIGYHAQLGPLGEILGVEAPKIALRLNATLIDGRVARTTDADALLHLASAASPAESLLAQNAPGAQAGLHELAQHVEEKLTRAVNDLPENVPQSRRLRGSAEKIAQDIRRFSDRLGKAWTQTQEADLQRATKLWNQVFPGGVLQERRWNVLHFVAKHGTEWIAELADYLLEDPLKLAHRLVLFADKPQDGTRELAQKTLTSSENPDGS